MGLCVARLPTRHFHGHHQRCQEAPSRGGPGHGLWVAGRTSFPPVLEPSGCGCLGREAVGPQGSSRPCGRRAEGWGPAAGLRGSSPTAGWSSGPQVMILITGAHKAFALYKAIEEGVSHMWTVSAFQQHPRTVFVCDEDATLELKVKTVKYFKGAGRRGRGGGHRPWGGSRCLALATVADT